MSKLFNISIYTPIKKIYEGEIMSLIAPGEVGSFGVLANHAPIISNLVPGKIVIKQNATSSPAIFHSKGKGFLEVLKNRATLLLDSVE